MNNEVNRNNGNGWLPGRGMVIGLVLGIIFMSALDNIILGLVIGIMSGIVIDMAGKD